MLRTTSSRSLLIPCEDSDGESTTFCNYAQVTEKASGPALSSPCKIVIGFNLEAEKKPPLDVCESPRSVLDLSAALSSQDKQQVVARSPRSGLGSLLAAKSGSKENVGAGIDNVVHASACMVSAANKINQSIRSPSKLTAGPVRMPDFDPMDEDICASQGQSLHLSLLADMDDELLDADISPLRVGGPRTHLSEDMNPNPNDADIPKAMNCFCAKGGFLDADKCKEQKQVLVSPSKDVRNSFTVPYVNTYNKEPVGNWWHAPGYTRPTNSVNLCKGERCVLPSEEQFCHHFNFDNEVAGNHPSIFSASSPPPCPRSCVRASPGFLKMCNFCGRSLRLGKDIFMYRGDQPFCSAECRYQKIVLDESKGKRGG